MYNLPYVSMSLLHIRCLSSGHISRLETFLLFPISWSFIMYFACHFRHFNHSCYLLTNLWVLYRKLMGRRRHWLLIDTSILISIHVPRVSSSHSDTGSVQPICLWCWLIFSPLCQEIYYCQSLTLSVCLSVKKRKIAPFFLPLIELGDFWSDDMPLRCLPNVGLRFFIYRPNSLKFP